MWDRSGVLRDFHGRLHGTPASKGHSHMHFWGGNPQKYGWTAPAPRFHASTPPPTGPERRPCKRHCKRTRGQMVPLEHIRRLQVQNINTLQCEIQTVPHCVVMCSAGLCLQKSFPKLLLTSKLRRLHKKLYIYIYEADLLFFV